MALERGVVERLRKDIRPVLFGRDVYHLDSTSSIQFTHLENLAFHVSGVLAVGGTVAKMVSSRIAGAYLHWAVLDDYLMIDASA